MIRLVSVVASDGLVHARLYDVTNRATWFYSTTLPGNVLPFPSSRFSSLLIFKAGLKSSHCELIPESEYIARNAPQAVPPPSNVEPPEENQLVTPSSVPDVYPLDLTTINLDEE